VIRQSWRILYDEQLHVIDEQVFPVPRSQGRWQGRAIGDKTMRSTDELVTWSVS
jgi:hypothetical protein